MIEAFQKFLALSEQERKDVFETAARRLDTVASYIEKDLWVCFTLDLLHNRLPEEHPRLLFKGGTSLSKGHGLIERFSEDIDIVVSREDLGFTGARDPTVEVDGVSGKQRTALFVELRASCATYISSVLRQELHGQIKELESACIIEVDSDDDQTLLIEYPTLFPRPGMDYVLPRVKIETGARSALEPQQRVCVTPYVSTELTGWSFDVGGIDAISPERTYCEKLLILHGCYYGYQDEGRIPKDRDRISRHYYDVAMITSTGPGEAALSDRKLLPAVRAHNLLVFKTAWKKFDLAVPGTMHLVPEGGLRAAIEKDYAAMQGMILGEAPAFEWVMEQLRVAERRINSPRHQSASR